MRLLLSVLVLGLVYLGACATEYQRRQDRLRERYVSGCTVQHEAPAGGAPASPGIDASVVSRVGEVVERSVDELQVCYIEALQVWPRLEGRVVLHFEIAPDGTVAAPAVAMHYSNIYEESLGCCAARLAQSWKFPASADGARLQIDYPFEFVTDYLKFQLRAPEAPAPFRSPFPATVVLAPPMARSTTDLHNVW